MDDQRTKVPDKHRDMPATVGLVHEIRDELKADIRALDHKVDSLEHKMIAGFHAIGAEVQGVKSEVQGVKSEVQAMKSDVHAMRALMEEMRSENRIVLDAYKLVNQRVDRVEEFQAEMKESLQLLASPKKPIN